MNPGPTAACSAQDEPLQLSLLAGLSRPAPHSAGTPAGRRLPVARVLIESSLPHLDRPFDYSVPADLDEAAQARRPGQGQIQRPGTRRATSSNAPRSPTPATPWCRCTRWSRRSPVLTPAVRELAGRVAARYAGTVSDVLRVAVPPRDGEAGEGVRLRTGRLDPALFGDRRATGNRADRRGAGDSCRVPRAGWAGYRNGPAFLQHLRRGSPRGRYSARSRASARRLAAPDRRGGGRRPALRPRRRSGGARLPRPGPGGRGPAELLPAGDIARLTADDGPTPRYRNYLRVLSGSAGVAVGTRSAAYAPVHNLGLVVCWDDGDDLHIEQRSPYAHTREVLLLRADQEGAACLLAGAHAQHRIAAAGGGRLGQAGRGGAHRGPADGSARPEYRRQLRTGTGPAGPGGPAAGRRVAGGQGGAGARARCWSRWPGPATRRRWPAKPAGNLPAARLQRAAGRRRGQREFRRAAVPLVLEAAPGWRCVHCTAPAPAGRAGALRTAEELGRAFPGQGRDYVVR